MGSFPATIGPYRVLGLLGAGGMGSVFKAESAEGHIVALKMIGRQADTQVRFRPGSPLPAFSRPRRLALVREARLAMGLTHPNIIRVFDYGQHCGLLYVVMEFLEGRTLGSTLLSGAPTLQQSLIWMAQVCDALGFAHRRGIIHRDMHFSNVFVLPNDTVKLLDFGLARRVEDILGPGQTAGVRQFLAPEILSGRGKPSAATDIWSTGIILKRLLGGTLPVYGRGRIAVGGSKVSLPFLDPALPCAADLQLLLSRALEIRPDRRLANAAEFATKLRRIAAEVTLARSTTPERPTHETTQPRILSLPVSAPSVSQPASVFVSRRRNRRRVLQDRLASFDIPQHLKRTATVTWVGLMILGRLQPSTKLPVPALVAALALALLPVALIFPANLLLAFAATLTELPRCRSCRDPMRCRREVTQYAVNDTAVSLGIADSLAALKAGLWDDAGQLLSVHGQDMEPMLPRRIADAPLRLHLNFFACSRCPDESAVFTVQEHREDRWVTRAEYVKAYRRPLARSAQPVRPRFRLPYALPSLYAAARTALATIRISVVQWVCAAGVLFILWFTWFDLYGMR